MRFGEGLRHHRSRILPIFGVLVLLAFLLFYLLIVPNLNLIPGSFGQGNGVTSPSPTEQKIINAFNSLYSAEKSGGNVTGLANQLNQSAYLNDEGNLVNQTNPSQAASFYSQASALASQVSAQAPLVGASGAMQKRNAELVYLGEMSFLGVLAILAGIFLPKFFWNYWIKNRKNWTVRKRAKSGVGATQVQAALLVIIFILGLGVSYNYFDAHAVNSPYSEMALLGPNETLSNYPRNVTAGQNFTLYLHVGDYEGHLMYYKIVQVVGNLSTVVNQTSTIQSPPIATYSFILANNETALRQLTLNLPTQSPFVKVAFEMFVYSVSDQSFVYYGQWNQIVLNVTA